MPMVLQLSGKKSISLTYLIVGAVKSNIGFKSISNI